MPEVTEQPATPVRTWRPMVLWTLAILLVLGLAWSATALYLATHKTEGVLLSVEPGFRHARELWNPLSPENAVAELGGPQKAAAKIRLWRHFGWIAADRTVSDTYKRRIACDILCCCGQEGVPVLEGLVRDQDVEVRVAAAEALKKIRGEEALPFVAVKTYRQLLHVPPKTVRWADVVDFDKLDERLSSIDCLYVNILGVNEGYVEWCPNDSPPSRDETLAWLWFIRPDLGSEIASDAPECLRELIKAYQAGNMEAWWNRR